MKIFKKVLIVNICLSVAGLIISLVILEICLKVQYNNVHQKTKDIDTRFTYSENPGLIFSYIPNKYNLNSHGYNDCEHTYKKPEGVFRIIVIGDSIAEGLYVEREQSFAKILEKLLNDNLDSRKVEVIILARSGYSISQELTIFKEKAFLYNPDLIIWSYCLNDIGHPVYHDVNSNLGQYFFRPKLHIAHFIASKLFFIKEKIKSRNYEEQYTYAMLHRIYWKKIEYAIKMIGQTSKQKNIPTVFLIFPIFVENIETFSEYPIVSLHRKLYSVATEEGLIALDILDCFKAFSIEELRNHALSYFDILHPNEKGHKVVADYLYRRIVSIVNYEYSSN
ncbi:MAG: SGNH/GDSL hydrolase family protein [Candidatus Gorgyraea atricola]|nr:SGNH/GDSL hydrolase family protein [Candidatus Gorgyraea atricola]